MHLELGYHIYNKTINERSRYYEISQGTVDFSKNTITFGGYSKKVKRTHDNQRIRPNAGQRHDPFN